MATNVNHDKFKLKKSLTISNSNNSYSPQARNFKFWFPKPIKLKIIADK